MASIRKKSKDSYQLIAYIRYDDDGKQERRYKTWRVPSGMTAAAAKREAQKAADAWEASLRGGSAKKQVRFSEFVEKWFAVHGEMKLKAKTLDGYRGLLPVLLDEFGTLYLDEIDSEHIADFYARLLRTPKQALYRCPAGLSKLLEEKGFTHDSLCMAAGVSESVVTAAVRGQNIRQASAEKISAALGVSMATLFEKVVSNECLSPSTVLHYHRLLSSILEKAFVWGYISKNPAHNVDKPTLMKKAPHYLQPDDIFALLEQLDKDNVPPKYRLAILIMILVGLRREEVIGLQWRDINFKAGIMEVHRGVVYIHGKGIQINDTKTDSSYRIVALPDCMLAEFQRYKAYKEEQLAVLGGELQETDFLFQEVDGHLLWPSSLTTWVRKFYKKHPELEKVSPHGYRHTNASIQINNGVPLTSVADSLGHANVQTTAIVYAHVIKSARVAAARKVDSVLSPYMNEQAL